MLNIIKKQIANNFTDGVFEKNYIVIHETDNEGTGANAMAHFNYWNNDPNAQASATFVVDDTSEVQMMDLVDRSWAIGVIYGDPRNVTDATNANTINIEICVNADGNYAKARQNAIELVKYLMPLTGIPASRVIRHYDACLKWCPRRMLDTPSLWSDFKAQISGSAPILPVPVIVPVSPIVIDNSVKDLQRILVRLGFKGKNGLVITVDGLKGTNTDFATKAFQGVMALTQDAIAGSNTLTAMQSILAKPICGINFGRNYYATRYIQWRVGSGVDGGFGVNTASAVKVWQSNHSLISDGIVGNGTWCKLIG